MTQKPPQNDIYVITGVPKLNVESVDEDRDQVGSESVPTSRRSYLGLFLGIGAAFFFSLSILTMKQLEKYPFYTYCVYRGTMSLIVTLTIVVFRKIHPFPKKARKILVFRGVLGVIAIGLIFFCIINTSLVVSTTIMQLPPIISTILGRLFYKEPCSVLKVLSVLCTFLGVILVSDPTKMVGEGSEGNKTQILGVLSGVVAAIGSSVMAMLIKNIREVPVFAIQFIYSMVFTSISAVLSLSFHSIVAEKPIDYLYFFGNSACVCTAELMIARAMQIEHATVLCAAMVLEVAFSTIWQWIFYHSFLNAFEISGVLVLIVAIGLLCVWKYVDSMPDAAPWKQKLKFILK